MPYYFFNRCTEDKLSKLDLLAEELELSKGTRGNYRGQYQWDGHKENSFSLRHNMGLMHLTYNPNNTKWTLSIQTLSVPEKTYGDSHINMIMRRLISITGSTEVSDSQVENIDISNFQD